jgi:hypothetical protein
MHDTATRSNLSVMQEAVPLSSYPTVVGLVLLVVYHAIEAKLFSQKLALRFATGNSNNSGAPTLSQLGGEKANRAGCA